jgi:GYF domain 2
MKTLAYLKKMDKVHWYIEIFRGVEGPFNKRQLKNDERLTPDTYVWREGFDNWKQIKDVSELNDLFEDYVVIEDEKNTEPLVDILDDEIALEVNGGSPPYLYWILIVLIFITYFVYTYYFGT